MVLPERHGSEFVALQPPLPCVSDQWGGGFVHRISPNQMMVVGWPGSSEGGSANAVAEGACFTVADVTVAVNEQNRITFRDVSMRAGDAPGEWQLDLKEPRFQASVTDVLAMIRKDQHIRICAAQDVEASDRSTGFETIGMAPVAVPLFSWQDLDTTVRFLGRQFSAPLLITGMTGGIEQGARINRRLAKAASALQIPMGVGSQRMALDNPQYRSIFTVKDEAPDLFLIGNLGCAQIAAAPSNQAAVRMAQDAVDMISADALAIHLNVLQEIVQVEGDRFFGTFFERLAAIVADLKTPVMIKEVGVGIDVASAQSLASLGVAAIDVGGKGGTSWSRIEGLRSGSKLTQNVAETFRDFGLPTAVSLAGVRRALPQIPLVATGGVRDGMTIAKAIGLGAQMVGVGLPVFRAALESEEGPREVLERMIYELKTAMMVTGSKTLPALKSKVRPTPGYQDLLTQWLSEEQTSER